MLKASLTRLLALIVLLSIWEIVSFFYPPDFLPPPNLVAVKMAEIIRSGEFAKHFGQTLSRVLIGVSVAFLASVAIGIPMGLRIFYERFFDAAVLVGIMIPGLAWSVITLMWFGISELFPIFTVFIVTTPLMAINVWEGTKSLDRDLMEMAKSYNSSRTVALFDVILPQLVPFFFAAIRYGLSVGWKTVVITEVFGLSAGVGFKLKESLDLFEMAAALGWTLSFTLIMAFIEYGVLRRLESHATRWRPVPSP